VADNLLAALIDASLGRDESAGIDLTKAQREITRAIADLYDWRQTAALEVLEIESASTIADRKFLRLPFALQCPETLTCYQEYPRFRATKRTDTNCFLRFEQQRELTPIVSLITQPSPTRALRGTTAHRSGRSSTSSLA
jgi:hypothetical protein